MKSIKLEESSIPEHLSEITSLNPERTPYYKICSILQKCANADECCLVLDTVYGESWMDFGELDFGELDFGKTNITKKVIIDYWEKHKRQIKYTRLAKPKTPKRNPRYTNHIVKPKAISYRQDGGVSQHRRHYFGDTFDLFLCEDPTKAYNYKNNHPEELDQVIRGFRKLRKHYSNIKLEEVVTIRCHLKHIDACHKSGKFDWKYFELRLNVLREVFCLGDKELELLSAIGLKKIDNEATNRVIQVKITNLRQKIGITIPNTLSTNPTSLSSEEKANLGLELLSQFYNQDWLLAPLCCFVTKNQEVLREYYPKSQVLNQKNSSKKTTNKTTN